MSSLFEHPDSQDFFDRTYSLLMSEADRGCVLLGASLLDEELTKMFESLLPLDTSNNRKKEIFDNNGPFGSLSSKLDIAYVCHLLPKDIVNCIHLLRKLRNKLAHQSITFTLKDNLESIFEIFDKTNGNLASGIAHMSVTFVIDQFVEKAMETVHPVDLEKKLFSSRQEALDFLMQNKEVKTTLEEKRIKVMFVLGVASLGALIIINREKSKEMFASKA